MTTSAQSSPHGSLKTYLSVFGALGALTLVSFAVANSQALMANPPVGWSIMMAVSAMKALLVVLFFMHLKYEANWKYVLTIPTLGMAAFLVFALVPDIGERTERYSEERWLHAAVPHVEAAPVPHVEAAPELTVGGAPVANPIPAEGEDVLETSEPDAIEPQAAEPQALPETPSP